MATNVGQPTGQVQAQGAPMQQFWGSAEPQLAYSQGQAYNQMYGPGGYEQQLAMGLVNQNFQQTGINQDYANQLQRLGISQQGLGIQQGALSRQLPLLTQEHGLTNQDLAQAIKSAWQGADVANRGLRSSAIASGSLQSKGVGQQFGDIKNQLTNQLGTIGREQQRENLSFKESKAQLADQEKQLNLTAKGLGIDKRELSQRTTQALQNLGLSTFLNEQQIYGAINDLQNGQWNPVQQILPDLYNSMGIRATAGGQ